MDPELVAEIRDWAAKPGPVKFLLALHTRLVNGGGIDRPLHFTSPPLSDDQCGELVELFGNNGAVRPDRINLRLAQQSLDSGRVRLGLHDLVELVHGPVVTRTERRQRELTEKTARVAHDRQELLAIMDPVAQLAFERRLLAALPPGSTYRVPEETRTKAGAWSSFSAAIRAAAVWWPCWEAGEIVTEKGLAATALGGAKNWTDAGRAAFHNLVRVPFDRAVKVADTEIRLRGPLVWRLDDVLVDAHRSRPWVSLPARGVLRLGLIEGTPRGVLLVENGESFDRVCTETAAPDSWLCVWIKGFATDGLISFVRRLPEVPLVAWCDLDPSGIEIIQDVQRRAGRKVHPVGMTADLWELGAKRADEPADRKRWQERAAQLALHGPPALRELARHIATTGERVEQEGIEVCNPVIRELTGRLAEIVREAGFPCS
ncbi:Wadjet anti-phage system protein JetD domain-containing protein [Amycolatopsis vastitatis]|uniref:Wadjet protein JetD C-terminal domain-containing protein n=1 Tax=Amycolatopsis vastitatis TaxID=1905142 RepID=A0A229SNW5_9PSEU|nr:Wadjet anti-phage system protein JetD domain-containing protein [Amycolatopsis vastitatis]OXM60502.1 hypothetical protein CF165_42540 [Amycolatopsis vastitatis]